MKFNSATPRTTLAFANPSRSFLRGYTFIIKNILRVIFKTYWSFATFNLVILTWLLEERSRNWLSIVKDMEKVIFEIAEYQPEKWILKNSKRDILIWLILPFISCVILGKILNCFFVSVSLPVSEEW